MLHDDRNYAPPEDILGPHNSDETVWGYPLDLADWESFAVAHVPWRLAGETVTAYTARVASLFPGVPAEAIGQWFGHASTHPA